MARYDRDILELKKDLLSSEKKLTALKEEKQQFDQKLNKQIAMNEYANFQNEILQKQISGLAEAIDKAESMMAQLLKEKKEIVDAKILDYLQGNLEFKDIKLFEYFAKSTNFNFEVLLFNFYF